MENGPETFESRLSFDYHELEAKVVGFMTEVLSNESPDCIILVQRKGERIFRDLFHHHALITNDVKVISDDEIRDLEQVPQKVLILDDSIKTGKNVCRALKSTLKRFPNAEISVATLISNRDVEARICDGYRPRFVAMEMYRDATEQGENSDFILFLTAKSGIRYGTGYPGLEFTADCNNLQKMACFIGNLITDMFGENTVQDDANSYKKAMKVTFNLDSSPDDGICTSDQKVFLFMDVGITGMSVKVELLINPKADSIHELRNASEVSDYIEKMLEESLKRMKSEVFCGLNDRGWLVDEPRITRPSENRLS